MANSVTYPGYGAYPANLQGYSMNTSPPGTLGTAPSYSTYDNSKAAYSAQAMLSFSTPTAPQQYSTAYYTQPAPSISYGQQVLEQGSLQHSTSAGLYNNYPSSAATLQQSTSLAAQAQQLAAAASLQRGYQSPPYGAAAAGYTSAAGLSSAAAAAAAAASYDTALYKQAVYNEQVAAAAQATQQLSLNSGFQHKNDIVDAYPNGNRLQIISQSMQTQQILPSKQHIPSPPPIVSQTRNTSSYSHLDALQSTFSAHPPPPPPPPPPKPSHIQSSRISSSSSSSLNMRSHSNTDSSPLPPTNHHTMNFRKNVVSYKMPFQKSNLHMHNHLCDICKVSCASSKTYKDHIEGQRHKKRVALREQQKKEEAAAAPASGASYKCVLCDVTCTGEETFNAHIRGTKHYKAEKLYKELGKDIPAPIITGDTEPKPEVPIVGANLIEIKSDSTKSAKVIYHCKMCDCTFNDELAKNLHLKGRRHRLNYKKQYDPNLKVEIQPSKREKIAEQKARRRAEEAERRRNMVQSRRHLWEQNRWRAEEEWREWAEARSWHQYDALKQKQDKEYEDRCTAEKDRCKKAGLPEPTLPPRPSLPPPPPRVNNARFLSPGQDEFLMVQKQTMVSPKEEQLEALQDLVNGLDHALREVSDQLSNEARDAVVPGVPNTVAPTRIISTMHKTGKLTKAILLSDDLSTDIAVLCTEKPTQGILNTVFNKLKEVYKDGDKLSLHIDRAMIVVEKWAAESELRVQIKLTSPAFSSSITEDERRLELVTKVLERKYCLLTMGDVNESGWYKMHLKPNTPAVIVLRILSSLRQEPHSVLKDLSIQALQVLIYISLKTFGHIKNVAPTLILRRFFEILAAGYVLTEELNPPWQQGKPDSSSSSTPDLLGKLEPSKREAITEYSQFAVRCIALGNLHKVLRIPPPPNPTAYAATTTPRTGEI